MRVVSGSKRGRKLSAPVGEDIRPTTDNVKESVFNIIQFEIEGRTVLDLFAGTGQLGIECLSRGAASAVFVDNSRRSLAAVKNNLISCGLEASVICSDAENYLCGCGKFDIIFIDPPYDSDLYEKVLNLICQFDILNDGGIIICESRKEKEIPVFLTSNYEYKTYLYGRIKITVIHKYLSSEG